MRGVGIWHMVACTYMYYVYCADLTDIRYVYICFLYARIPHRSWVPIFTLPSFPSFQAASECHPEQRGQAKHSLNPTSMESICCATVFSHKDMYFGCNPVSASAWCVLLLDSLCLCIFRCCVAENFRYIDSKYFFWLTHQNNIPSSNTSLFKRITSSQTFSEFSSLGMPLQYPENA